jgi:hypothetical protein
VHRVIGDRITRGNVSLRPFAAHEDGPELSTSGRRPGVLAGAILKTTLYQQTTQCPLRSAIQPVSSVSEEE